MAGRLVITPGPKFVGNKVIWQFVNKDAADPDHACGPAAVATILAGYHKILPTIEALRSFEKDYPADFFNGALGTSPGRIRRALSEYNVYHETIEGRVELADALCGGGAAISLVQNKPGLRGMGEGAHWFVVFGCDVNGVYVTNWDISPFIEWATFEQLWSAPIPTAAGLRGRVIYC
jgi:hypothetical protein